MNADCPCIRLLAGEIRSRSRARFARNLKAALAEDLTEEWERSVRESRRRAAFEGDDTVRTHPGSGRNGHPRYRELERKVLPTWNTPKGLRKLVGAMAGGMP